METSTLRRKRALAGLLLMAALRLPTQWAPGLSKAVSEAASSGPFIALFSALALFLIARIIVPQTRAIYLAAMVAALALVFELVKLLPGSKGQAFAWAELLGYAGGIGMGLLLDLWITASPQSPPSESPRRGSSQT